MNRLVFAAFAMCLGAFVPGSGEACGDKPVALRTYSRAERFL